MDSDDMYDRLLDRLYGSVSNCRCDDGSVPYAGNDLKQWVRVHSMAIYLMEHRRYVRTVAYLFVGMTVAFGASREMSVVAWNWIMLGLVVAAVMTVGLAGFFAIVIQGLAEAIERRMQMVRRVATSRVRE